MVEAISSARFQGGVSMWLPDPQGIAGILLLDRVWGESGSKAPRTQKPFHVLLIEDDPAIAEMYRLQLEYDGYRVTVAATGRNGLETVAADDPDIVLLDLLLPDRSGLEIMADIQEKLPSQPPVVILTNYGEPTMIDRGFSLGALEYLVKSRVTPSSVSQAIPGWIEQSRRRRPEPPN